MITPSEKQTLRANLEKYEGKINHMYLDSRGFVTVGVGHLIVDITISVYDPRTREIV